uniref:BY PROTMAP: gi/342319425/gb/EGU11374.1/ putative Chloride channel [Rhodotorula glutinis ATCC 204091] n=1 Tax=Rhodotorula toruloides TaxID=5286 RepID=A0A0K3CGA8_RHOTO
MPTLGTLALSALATALCALLISIALSLLSHPSSSSTALETRHWQPCTTAGPVLATRIANLDLDGLTIIPVTRLPRLRTRLPLPFSSHTLSLSADLSTSELVFRTLRIRSTTTRTLDLGREAVRVEAKGVEVDVSGSVGVKVTIGLSSGKSWSCRASGRMKMACSDSSARVVTQLVSGFHPRKGPRSADEQPAPRMVCLEARLVTFLVTDLMEGHVASDLVGDLGKFVERHVWVEEFGAMGRDERERVLGRFFAGEAEGKVGGVGFETSARPDSQDADSHKKGESGSLRFHTLFYGPTHLHSLPLSSASSPTSSNPFTNSSPSSEAAEVPLPIFARLNQTGLRSALFSSPLINQLTRGPPAVSLTSSSFERIKLREAGVELVPSARELLEGSPTGEARELVLRVTGLEATLELSFRVGAELRSAPALMSGLKVLEERGTARTEVVAGRVGGSARAQGVERKDGKEALEDEEEEEEGISIHLPLRFSRQEGRVILSSTHSSTSSSSSCSAGRRDKHKGVRLEGSFGTVAPRVRLESRLGKALGEKVVNALLDGVKTHLAALTAPLASYFLADLVRERMQRALDYVCEKVGTEGGVVWSVPARKEEGEGWM